RGDGRLCRPARGRARRRAGARASRGVERRRRGRPRALALRRGARGPAGGGAARGRGYRGRVSDRASTLPEALPPESRPVGQLVAEAIRLYGRRYWPAAAVEGAGLRESFQRSLTLARADVVHALGGLATFALVFGLTKGVLILLLRGQGDATDRVALFLADLVLSPLLFLGPALLYADQAARSKLRP